MGSLKIASAEPRPDMSLFKASLLLSVLTLNLVRAAPAELLAGRVLTHDHAFNNLVDVRSLRALLSNAGVSLVRTVPHVTHLNHVTPATSLRSLVSSPSPWSTWTASVTSTLTTSSDCWGPGRPTSPPSHLQWGRWPGLRWTYHSSDSCQMERSSSTK